MKVALLQVRRRVSAQSLHAGLARMPAVLMSFGSSHGVPKDCVRWKRKLTVATSAVFLWILRIR